MPLSNDAAALCANCLRSGPAFDHAWAAFRLAPPIQGLIHQMKYAADLRAAHTLGCLAAARLGSRREPLPDLLIPVPLHHSRLRTRGYNQAVEIARAMQQVLAIRMSSRTARRSRATPDQIGQSAVQRRRNLKGAFAVRESVRGLKVALVDDVMTTGATLMELASVCRNAGAARVEAWAIARAL
jgi:ComF family protein